MIEMDDLINEDLGWRRVSDDDEWSARDRRERDAAYFRGMAALQRRDRRERLAREIAVVKAAQKAGLPVRRAVIEGVAVEFGRPEPEPAAPVDEVEAWIRKQQESHAH